MFVSIFRAFVQAFIVYTFKCQQKARLQILNILKMHFWSILRTRTVWFCIFDAFVFQF